MNDSNMTGTGFPNAVPQDSSNRETGKKTTRSAIGAKARKHSASCVFLSKL